jgi:adenylate cyclase
MEGLNKHLGTHILVSEDVLGQQDDFLVRRLGQFILVGKSKPVAAYELMCRMEESTDLQKSLCSAFSKALDAFERKSWNEAISSLNACLKLNPDDGPSLFYHDRCKKLIGNPPENTWNGVIRLHNK